MAKKSKRARLLAKTKEALEVALIPLKERKDKHNLNGWILDREGEVSELELKIEELKSAKTLDADKILDAVDALEVKKARVIQGQELFTELFTPTEDEE